MSQPKFYAGATYSNTASLPSSSTIGTAQHAKHNPLPQTRRRAPSDVDEYVVSRAVPTFVGGSGSGSGDHINNNSYAYTYNRKRGNVRSEQHLAPTYEHGHDLNAGGPIPASSNTGIPFSISKVNNNNNNFHYHQKGRQQLATTWSTTGDGIGVGISHRLNLAQDKVDDDIDRDDDDDDDDEDEDEDDEDGYKGEDIYEDGYEVGYGEGEAGDEISGADDLHRNDHASIKHETNNMRIEAPELRVGPDQDRPHQPSQRQSRMNGGMNKTMPTSRFAEPTAVTSGGAAATSGSTSYTPSPYTHPSHPTQAHNRHFQSRHQYQYHQDPLHHQHNHYHHQPSASVSGSIYSGNSHNQSYSHRYNPPRPQQQQQQQQQRQQQQQIRAASSLAFYNTENSNSNSNSNSLASSPPPSSSWRARRTSRTSPPTAPPRVSSLLPPPRSTATTTNHPSSPRIPLSADTVTAPIIPTIPGIPPSIPSIPSLPTTTLPVTLLDATAVGATTTHTATTGSSNPAPAITTLTSPLSNAIPQEAPTHAQFATPFFDLLNHRTALPDTETVLASGSGTSTDTAGPGPGSGSGSGSGSGARRRSHSRANSFGTVGDSLRNLNRWSSSTASSRLSAWDYHHYQQQQAQQQKSTPFARRMSVDSIGRLPLHHDPVPVPAPVPEPLPPIHASPRKLSKRRPSQGTSASPSTQGRVRVRAGSTSTSTTSALAAGGGAISSFRRDRSSSPLPPSSSAPPPNLPPIISLPPLDTNPESSFRLGSPGIMSRASPGLSTPNSVFANQHGNAEPQDYFWSDLSNPTRTASPATRANLSLLPPAPVTRDRDVVPERRGHSRSRSAAKGGVAESAKSRDRSSNKPSQKAMLSKALSKANTAVQLDNAQNYGAAREAYLEACELLQQVLARTNGDDDRKKLEAIRQTYTSRIEELDGLVPVNLHGDKALPARPDSFDYHGAQMEIARIDGQSDIATITRLHRDESPNSQVLSQTAPRSSAFPPYSDFSKPVDANRSPRQISFSRSPMRRNFEGSALAIPRQPSDSFLPAPLSPRRPISPARAPSPEPVIRQDFSLPSERDRLAVSLEMRSHRRNLSRESASWLDPIDESGGSTTSSVHSRSSSRIMRKHIRQPSGDTEAEFDAALDAAVEAAYDDGYEPMEPPAMTYGDIDEDRIATSMRRVELAKELVRQREREAAIEMAREHERQRQMSLGQQSQTYGGDFFDANDSDEEEERMLEEMTKGYVMEDFTLDQQPRYQSSVPRQSDSSGLTSRTWHSSMGSNPPTGATTLSAVSEMTSSGNLHKASSPPMPPPTHSLPQPPLNRPSSTTGVRNRRLSGQTTKQLKIETSKLGPPPTIPPPPVTTSSVIQPQPTSNYIVQQRQALSAISTRAGPFSMRAPSSPVRGISPADAARPVSPPGGQDDEVRTDSPSSARAGMRKNFSSSSLKSLKSRQISVSHIDDADPLPMTPLSQQVSNSSVSRLPMMPALPTPIVTTFAEKMAGGFGGLHLFDSDFHSPVARSPSSIHHDQQQNSSEIPLPLEPCPSEPMFRPFWLMRALYQTLAHPRGGYVSTRLFVPQDAWKVKGVKLRNLEDKMSQCDLLTAALLKLARVDSTDADALLDEMQSFENILEVVQATLSRKLGTEVGTQGIITFKDEKETEVPPVPRNNSISGKGGAFSWRRLRSKGSAVNLASTYGVKGNSSGGGASAVPGIPEKDVVSPGNSMMPSLPMVAHPSSRPAKRDVSSAKFDGPNANYMASLARLFDAAQTVDQIARQVDDPGLRHADKTQVGLELCTRHAAEFFGFYICRFVLTDLGMLLDKFVKRGSEWVLN